MRDSALVIAINYLSKFRWLYVGQCSVVVEKSAAMASFANVVQSVIL